MDGNAVVSDLLLKRNSEKFDDCVRVNPEWRNKTNDKLGF